MNLAAWGIAADILGVALVAIAAPGFVEDQHGQHVGHPWLAVKLGWRWQNTARVLRLGWVLIIGGFVLQFIAALDG